MSNISVVLMVYNRKEFYKEALDSLKEQTDKDFDVVIVSNIEIEYDLSVFQDVNIIASPESILGGYLAGMQVAKNDIVAFLDDDDKFVPSKISSIRIANIEGYYHNDYFDFRRCECL